MSVDLRTRYLGLELRNPIVAAASPLTSNVDSLRRLQDAGASAVVLPSLFEEQIEHEEMATSELMLVGTEVSPEASGFFPEIAHGGSGVDKYLALIGEEYAAMEQTGKLLKDTTKVGVGVSQYFKAEIEA